jgi:hypothetical protein
MTARHIRIGLGVPSVEKGVKSNHDLVSMIKEDPPKYKTPHTGIFCSH